ncbi:MAG: DUF368 domain-containing protein [Verrucomicrobiota bacterium]|nr:DUF368 domain-containing protein [Verrucomicrobiota bacterium]
MIYLIKDLIYGFILGIANIIPGVSGGTFALILGIYERLLKILTSINKKNILKILSLGRNILKRKTNSIDNLLIHLRELDIYFLARIGVGAIFSILILSSLMKFLLKNHYEYTYAFFSGLIIISLIVPYKLLRKKKILLLLPFIVGIVLTIAVSANVNPANKIKKKSQFYKQQQQQQNVSNETTSSALNLSENTESKKYFAYTYKYSTSDYITIFCSGAIAISAMILPGISGSLVLILLGQYYAVINAISHLRQLSVDDILFLSAFSVGMIFGILIFARIINYFLSRFYNSTMSFLGGLIFGSLYALWPFKQIEILDVYVKENGIITFLIHKQVHTNINVLPANTNMILFSCFFAVAGALIMIFFVKKGIKEGKLE